MVEYEFVTNSLGRRVPTEVNGRKAIPYKGLGEELPEGRRWAPPKRSFHQYPMDGNKIVDGLGKALRLCGLEDGMTISTHHHFRNGDVVANMTFDVAADMGIRDLVWLPSAAFPCHEPMIERMEDGTLHHIEGSLNGPLGEHASYGNMKGLAVLRSHGGRWRAVQDGEVKIDIAVIAASSSDPYGNCTGSIGPNACGSLSYALVDATYADYVIVVTDNIVDFPCVPWHIRGSYVDFVVEVENVGDPKEITSGTTVITRSPDRLLIAEMAARFVEEAGILRNGFSFQAGAGGTSLAFVNFLSRRMRERNVKARWISGGGNRFTVEMLEKGQTDYLLEAQPFDIEAIESASKNPRHLRTSVFMVYNPHSKGIIASMQDLVVLGATEVDVDFNANVVTHSDGRLLHGIGGWQNCLFARCTMLPIPLVRNRIPTVVREATTICGPGELVDVVVTERGIAVNPLRKDLLEALEDTDLPIRSIEGLMEEAEEICGGTPDEPEVDTDAPIGVVEWVDGTLLDTIWRVETPE